MLIAIDGPAGAGKSTVARALAQRLGFAYLDSGAMYRAVALSATERGLKFSNGEVLASLAKAVDFCFSRDENGRPQLFLDGIDVTKQIRTPEISRASSEVAKLGQVRLELVAKQREILASGDYVAEGRDIGTVVAPDADLKIFLTADSRERARRRTQDLMSDGDTVVGDSVKQDLLSRDQADMARAVSPLAVASDAIALDTTKLSIDQVVEKVIGLLGQRK